MDNFIGLIGEKKNNYSTSHASSRLEKPYGQLRFNLSLEMFTGTVQICVVCKRGKFPNENEKINFEFQKHKILRVSEAARSSGLRVSRVASRLLLLIRLGSSTATAALVVTLLIRAAASVVVITTTAAARARPSKTCGTCRNRDVI